MKLNSESYLAHYYYAAMSMGTDGEARDPVIELSLRTCIKLNPNFAPAYDALAMYYMGDPATINEAHMLNLRAIMLEPDNINYRLNAAVVLLKINAMTMHSDAQGNDPRSKNFARRGLDRGPPSQADNPAIPGARP